MDDNFFYIEFIGLTSSGKTEIMGSIIDAWPHKGLAISTAYEFTALQKVRALTANPGYVWRWTILALKTIKNVTGTIHFLRRILPTLAIILAAKKQSRFLILDEGLLHKFTRLRKFSKSFVTLNELVSDSRLDSLIPHYPTHVVAVHINPEEYMRRKPQKTGEPLDEESAVRQINKMKYGFEDLKAYRDKGVQIIDVDNNNRNELRSATDKIIIEIDQQL